MPVPQSIPLSQRFSSFYPNTAPGIVGNLYMDMALPKGNISFSNLFAAYGTATASATAGAVTTVPHGLGSTPVVAFAIPLVAPNTTTAPAVVVQLQASTPFDNNNLYFVSNTASAEFLWFALCDNPVSNG